MIDTSKYVGKYVAVVVRDGEFVYMARGTLIEDKDDALTLRGIGSSLELISTRYDKPQKILSIGVDGTTLTLIKSGLVAITS